LSECALVADIGGTNARFALADLDTLELSEIRQVLCADHPSLEAALGDYVGGLSQLPERAAIAVAAPVTEEDISLTNSAWFFAKEELCRNLRLKQLHVLNDFEALALSLPHLTGAELHQIGGATPVERATKAVLGPGTGLGVAGLVWSGDGWIALPGEGGHMSLGADNERQLAINVKIPFGPGTATFKVDGGCTVSVQFRVTLASTDLISDFLGDQPTGSAPLAAYLLVIGFGLAGGAFLSRRLAAAQSQARH